MATRTWTSTSNTTWATAGNWNSGAGPAPSNGDSVVASVASTVAPTTGATLMLAGFDFSKLSHTMTASAVTSNITLSGGAILIMGVPGGAAAQVWAGDASNATSCTFYAASSCSSAGKIGGTSNFYGSSTYSATGERVATANFRESSTFAGALDVANMFDNSIVSPVAVCNTLNGYDNSSCSDIEPGVGVLVALNLANTVTYSGYNGCTIAGLNPMLPTAVQVKSGITFGYNASQTGTGTNRCCPAIPFGQV